MLQTVEPAYAKINLSLDVAARRPDGYHLIDGVMQSISLCDRVTVEFIPSADTDIRLAVTGNADVPGGERNLAVRVARLFLELTGRSGQVRIDLQKTIPMAGGLAGGSTDAAAVLRALNRLCGFPLNRAELCAAGAKLGADVPFCIVGGCQRTQGIGERLTPCPPMPECALVVAKRGEGVSTPWAYGRLDALYGSFAQGVSRPDANLPALLDALERQSLDGVCRSLFNLFEQAVSECQPDIAVLRELLLANGALAARMSGSGPSVFGVFRDMRQAEHVCGVLRLLGAQSFPCQPQGAFPDSE